MFSSLISLSEIGLWFSLCACGHVEGVIYQIFILYLVHKQWQSTPVLLPGKSHGQRSLAGHSLGRLVLDFFFFFGKCLITDKFPY